jgi:hypothetical protein
VTTPADDDSSSREDEEAPPAGESAGELERLMYPCGPMSFWPLPPPPG